MTDQFRILLQPEAVATMESAYAYIAQDAPEHAYRWFRGFEEAIHSLDNFPARCPLAPENAYFPLEIRQLLYGKKNGVYRILFTIDENTVHILHIRHGAQEWLSPQDAP